MPSAPRDIKSQVILAYNGTASAEYALNWSLEHFLHEDTHQLTLLTTVESPSDLGYFSTSGVLYNNSAVTDAYEEAAEKAKQAIENAAKRSKERGIETTYKILKGEARDGIVDYVKEAGAEVLILGSRDNGALKR